VGAHLQKGHRPTQRDVGRLRGSRYSLGLDRRGAQVLGRNFVSATPDPAPRALQQDPAAHAFYATLKRASQFTIYHRLHSARRAETRQKRMAGNGYGVVIEGSALLTVGA
jgi:hypothetical protein